MRTEAIKLDPTGRDIHEEARRLRSQGPVARVEMPHGVLGWSVTSYEVVKRLLSDPRVSKDPRKHWPSYINGEIGPDWPLNSWIEMDNMTTRYGIEHTRLRKPIARAFSPRRTEAMRPQVAKVVDGLLDKLADTPPGEVVDLKARFAFQVPAEVICDLFGVPESDRADALRGGEIAVDTSVTPEEAEANVRNWIGTFERLIELKRRSPGDDLTTDLIEGVDDDGNRLTHSELIGTLFLLLSAGSETVMNLLTSAVRELLSRPEQLELVRSGRATWDDVVEETLRVQSPIAQLPLRFAIEDIDVDGVTIPKGEPILIGFAAVGRDPDLHGSSAGDFDLTRRNKEHLSFGHGPHFCIGAPLARLEAGIALPALFQRFPEMALAVPAEDLQPQVTFIMNGNHTLPVYLARPAGR